MTITIALTGRLPSSWLWIFLAFWLAAPAFTAEPVIYAWAESMADDKRGHYPIDLLKLALAKSGEDYLATPSKYNLSSGAPCVTCNWIEALT